MLLCHVSPRGIQSGTERGMSWNKHPWCPCNVGQDLLPMASTTEC